MRQKSSAESSASSRLGGSTSFRGSLVGQLNEESHGTPTRTLTTDHVPGTYEPEGDPKRASRFLPQTARRPPADPPRKPPRKPPCRPPADHPQTTVLQTTVPQTKTPQTAVQSRASAFWLELPNNFYRLRSRRLAVWLLTPARLCASGRFALACVCRSKCASIFPAVLQDTTSHPAGWLLK